MDIKVIPFSTDFAEDYVDLTKRAFTAVSNSESPTDTVEYTKHLNGDTNPAGPSWCAIAMEGSQCVGSVMALPMSFPGKIGYQIGGFFVDKNHQGKGLGTKLLTELTSTLKNKPDSFIYTFPNSRSIDVFYKIGYKSMERVPTYILPWKMGLMKLEIASPSEVSFEKMNCVDTSGLIRDIKFIHWRYCGPGTDARYKFLIKRTNEHIDFVLVITNHKFRNIQFTVIVDIITSSPHFYPVAIRAAQCLRKFTYINTNIPNSYLPFIKVSIPEKVNPRPVFLLAYPSSNIDTGIAQWIMTGDWFGF